MRGRLDVFVLCLVSLGFAACGGGGGDDPYVPPAPGPVMADFSLPDVNPNSTTSGQDVSPSDFRGAVSAYYFAQGT